MENQAKKDLYTLERACRRRLALLEAEVALQDITDVRMLCAAVAALCGRSIHLEACSLPPHVAGLWLASPSTDYIFYAQDATPPHQEHIILHELAHLLCGHSHITVESEDLQHGWFPHLDAELIRGALSRSCYDTPTEREAELLASLIEQRWRAARPTSEVPPSITASEQETQRMLQQLDDFATKLRDD